MLLSHCGRGSSFVVVNKVYVESAFRVPVCSPGDQKAPLVAAAATHSSRCWRIGDQNVRETPGEFPVKGPHGVQTVASVGYQLEWFSLERAVEAGSSGKVLPGKRRGRLWRWRR